MKTDKARHDREYFVTRKVACSECNGTGVLSEFVRKQLQKNNTAILSSGLANTLIHEISPGEVQCTCLICDGSGQIKNDVPLKEALIETIRELADI
ncbi:MAG: hypothetical protein DRQ48_08060 [Gammaproteobacteria bacterium]|nr:MAG: hypothetical protein DRQ58_09105 [Gammaproteobacteria bacterium]RKZ69183.1 MAG: hypothetical protein DRQ48_08060 [Gammaproteobacteria bacterium]